MKEIYFSGGCFWGLQKYFNLIFGVLNTEVGYVNGEGNQTNYLSIEKTGHAEAVHIIYNDEIISLEELLDYYYEAIDPTSYDRQGKDKGHQYRLGIYYIDKEELPSIIKSLDELHKRIDGDVVIEVQCLRNFVLAESYHQDFLRHNPFGYCQINANVFEKVKLKQLENESYRVMKQKQGEEAFNNKYYKFFKDGIYVDKETLQPLFSSRDKYNAKTGFTTFSKPIVQENIIKKINIKNLKLKVEVLSGIGKNHIGYLFYDGPKKEGGLRYSVNSAALKFVPKAQMKKQGYEEYLPYI